MKKGFTLIELLIVIGIISILAAAIIVAISPGEHLSNARESTIRSHMQSIAVAVYNKAANDDMSLENAIIECTDATSETDFPSNIDEGNCNLPDVDHPIDGGVYTVDVASGRVKIGDTSGTISDITY